jgi:L-threonylcarbamoyladenylate synthase
MLQTLSINPERFSVADLAEAVDALRSGRVVAYPTDTLYGLAADPRRQEAVDAIFRIKGRDAARALPLIAADLSQVAAVSRLSTIGQQLARRFWPGPLTLVLSTIGPLADGVATHGTIAVRVPAHDVARALAAGFGFAITATSANHTGERPAASGEEIVRTLDKEIAVLVDAGPVRGGAPSTIVDVTAEAPRLVRAGVVPWDRVLESLG